MRRHCLLPLLLLLGGCAEPPFVEREIDQRIDKGVDKVAESGVVEICYGSDTPWAEVVALAAEECGAHNWQVELYKSVRYQCRVSAPHRATFRCFIPGYADPKTGRHMNPADKKALAAWKKAQTDKTGPAAKAGPGEKTDPGAETGTGLPMPAPVGTAAPMPAAPVRPLTPPDIAGKPVVPMTAMPVQPPLPVPDVSPSGGFTLTPKSWGQHFEE
jgi:hypothetical protein